MIRKKLVFLTGTRADFGKMKSLMRATQDSDEYEVHIFVTGMHMNSVYGSTVNEVKKEFSNIFEFINHDSIENMDRTLARTIDGFSHYLGQIKPDLIILHGDRVETLAGAIVGSLNNILVAHIEGGEVSGTIDELIRHSVSKMSHIHLVSNNDAKQRLIQLGECEEVIHVLGSPDKDLMQPEKIHSIEIVKKYYSIEFEDFAVAMFHPVTTENSCIAKYAKEFVNSLLQSGDNFIVIYPNNDIGSNEILQEYKRLENNDRFRIFPSIKFEYFLSFLKHGQYIIGNSSAGIHEAPYFATPTINIGTRQNNRFVSESIFNSAYDSDSILSAIKSAKNTVIKPSLDDFGNGDSDRKFLDILKKENFWDTSTQKSFQNLNWF